MEVAVAGELKILNGGAISAATFAEGNAGPVKVTAASIYIDEQTSPFGTGIFSSAQFEQLRQRRRHRSLVERAPIDDTWGLNRSIHAVGSALPDRSQSVPKI
jgi:hypothetical protein